MGWVRCPPSILEKSTANLIVSVSPVCFPALVLVLAEICPLMALFSSSICPSHLRIC